MPMAAPVTRTTPPATVKGMFDSGIQSCYPAPRMR
jgi:hypothetical protein